METVLDRKNIIEKKIDSNLKTLVYQQYGRLYGEVNLKKGKFIIVKNFPDTFQGNKELYSFIESFKSDQDVLAYLRIKKEKTNDVREIS